MIKRLLIVEDEETLCESLKRVLLREGYAVDAVSSAESALEVIEGKPYDLIITDIILPGISGIELLKKVKDRMPEQMVIIMTAYASLETAVESLRTGAYDYVVKPVMHEEIKQIVRNALEQCTLRQENILLRSEIGREYDLKGIVTESPAMQDVMREVRKASQTVGSVLLMGDVGTGKKLIARAIHQQGPRTEAPFVAVNLRTIPEALVEEKLFGYVKGGHHATVSKKGILEEACGGTVFLEGISSLSEAMQERLLKVMQDRELLRVGATEGVVADLRVISAAGADIEGMVEKGRFRKDLFHLLAGVLIKLPSLIERKEDIAPLADYFLIKFSRELGKDMQGFDDAALGMLQKYHWPGNARELRNVIERAVLLSGAGLLQSGDLPTLLRGT